MKAIVHFEKLGNIIDKVIDGITDNVFVDDYLKLLMINYIINVKENFLDFRLNEDEFKLVCKISKKLSTNQITKKSVVEMIKDNRIYKIAYLYNMGLSTYDIGSKTMCLSEKAAEIMLMKAKMLLHNIDTLSIK